MSPGQNILPVGIAADVAAGEEEDEDGPSAAGEMHDPSVSSSELQAESIGSGKGPAGGDAFFCKSSLP